MSKAAIFESLFIGQAGFFGLVLAGSPVLFIYRNEISSNLDSYEKKEKSEREFKEKAEKAQELLDDYSFKIFLPCGASGTGWILDYEIPEPGHYPTKWYIATNAHVANQFKFGEDTYGQTLPKGKLEEKPKIPSLPNFALNGYLSCQLSINQNYFDFGLSKEKNSKEFGSNYGLIASNKTKHPKIFYVPINFLNKDWSKWVMEDNYKDFAVIEVEFTTEGYAKEATDDFYGKYGEGNKTPINFFSYPWEKKKYQGNSKVTLYTMGYEGKKDFEYTFSYDPNTNSAPKLGKYASFANGQGRWVGDDEGRVNSVLLDGGDLKVHWNGKTLNRVGHFYLLDGHAMSPGASGGLVIDEDGDFWAIRSVGVAWANKALVTPLKSKDIEEPYLKIPKYDLILGGGPSQNSSYKQQVEKYIISKGKQTWLSTRWRWKYNPLDNK